MESPSHASRRSLSLPGNLWLLLALLLFAASSYIAFTQQPDTDFKTTHPLTTLDGWLTPLEQNAFRRLPTLNSQINDLFALTNSERLWLVGEKGLILHSSDNGLSWQQQEPPDPNANNRDRWQRSELENPLLELLLPRAAQAMEAPPPEQKTLKPLTTKSQPVIQQQQQYALPEDPSPALPAPVTPLPAVDPRTASLKAVQFIDSRRGWIVGERGLILTTRDGGRRWSRLPGPTDAGLRAVWFIDRERGWIAGDNGTLFATRNGGESWQAIELNISANLFALQFSDAQHGWLVGGRGTIFSTANGGESWQPEQSGTTADLYSLFARQSSLVWAAGANGTLLQRRDGLQLKQSLSSQSGRFYSGEWRSLDSGTQASLRAVLFSEEHGWLAGSDGTLLQSNDGGESWQPEHHLSAALLALARSGDGTLMLAAADGQLLSQHGSDAWQPLFSGDANQLNDLFFLDGQLGWAVGKRGLILHTRDGGQSWNPQPSPLAIDLYGVQFLNAEQGWISAAEGSILGTRDGGRSWQTLVNGGQQSLYELQFVDELRGWAVGSEGEILYTSDGGQRWQSQYRSDNTLNGLFFSDANNGWVVGGGGSLSGAGRGLILSTSDGGRSWREQRQDEWLRDITFINRQNGWSVGDNGLIVQTQDGGRSWQSQPSNSIDWLSSVQFQSRERGWVVGNRGALLSTNDGGQSWQNIDLKLNAWLTSIQLQGDSGWISGEGGLLLSYDPQQQLWSDQLHYERYPAAWYYPTLLLTFLLAIIGLRQQPHQIEEQQSVADLLASDRPLRAGDPDPLAFQSIADGLSAFLRNTRTEPPLTIAITGEWGTGKSSLMNLLRADLEGRGFCPVWFNAWHHQKGEHLLASLFANIRSQAIPPLSSVAGMRFRLQLLRLRGWRHWLRMSFSVLLIAAAYGYLQQHPEQLQIITTLLESPDLMSMGEKGGGLAIMFSSLLIPLFALWRTLRAFGINPAALVNAITGTQTGLGNKLQPGVRYQFAQEFDDVATALRPRTLVIFIDDLDRCSQQHVLEVLEAVNFLTSSGECHIVLGMARQWVETCVGLGFKELAEESALGSGTHSGVQQRREFAQHYLEKLINIEVPVPTPDEQGSLALLTPRLQPTRAPSSKLSQLLQRLTPLLRGALPVLLTLLLISIGLQLGQQIPPLYHALDPAPSTSISAEADPDSQQRPQIDTETPATPQTDSGREAPQGSAYYSSGETRNLNPSYLFMVMAAIPLLTLALIALLRRPQINVVDSADFGTALKIWHPWITLRRHTPRTIKRYLNRVRYLAMRYRDEQPPALPWYRHLFSKQPPKPAHHNDTLPEPLLVALSAIHHLNAQWLRDSDDCQALMQSDNEAALRQQLEKLLQRDFAELERNAAERKTAVDALCSSCRQHQQQFANWPPTSQQVAHFLAIIADTRIN